MNRLRYNFEYNWEPFTVGGKHLTFTQFKTTILYRNQCSHWGAVVYKWEGVLDKDSHTGETGILIGETDDIRQRINQYLHGQQTSGNAYWRSVLLEKGEIRLFILNLQTANFQIDDLSSCAFNTTDFSSNNRRLVYEQALVMREVEQKRPKVWIVNRKL